MKKQANFRELELPYRREEAVQLVAARDVSGLGGPGLKVERRITAKKEAPPSAEAGQKLGSVEVFVEGRSAGSTPLVAAEGYEEAGLWQKIRHWTSGAARGISNWVSNTASN